MANDDWERSVLHRMGVEWAQALFDAEVAAINARPLDAEAAKRRAHDIALTLANSA